MTNNNTLDLQAEILRLRAENAALQSQAKAPAKTTLRVSEKGAVSMYGLGRFPVTLYREQWERLLAESDRIREFILVNQESLKLKGE